MYDNLVHMGLQFQGFSRFNSMEMEKALFFGIADARNGMGGNAECIAFLGGVNKLPFKMNAVTILQVNPTSTLYM